ncbi:MAG: 2-amino-3,7-dideoxy-D-threo-hept-6-ulosonate synthase [Candidatus Methanolliviera sp. GoM_oil]|nr:MAG: 2-amino-3,7-dideoxy-D-threo-hept-6-ulosonate synthase [Candidatus Methanolliviera sp. GoM_oil]
MSHNSTVMKMFKVGKTIRIERIRDRKTGRTIIVPLDHGISIGPVKGLENLSETIDKVAEGGANAVLMHKGMVRAGHRGHGRDVGLIVHMSASTSLGTDPNDKVLVCDVEEAMKLGADVVSVHINIGSKTEADQLKKLGNVSKSCEEWGMPLLAMMYPRGDKIKDQFDPKIVAHVARVGAELGADIVKTNYTGDPDSFSKVVEGCPVPVVIAGGPKIDSDEKLLEMVEGALGAGAMGVSIGRNIFQHENPTAMTMAIRDIVHRNLSVKEALERL